MEPENSNNRVIARSSSTASTWEVFGRMLDGINPVTRLNIFGAQSLAEGAYLGEGKDAKVYRLNGNQDWVLKVYKTQNTQFITTLAEDKSLKIPKVVDLGDGRVLQPFVGGTAIANQLWGGTEAQSIADEITKQAKLKLGIHGNSEFIHLPEHGIKLGIDPSYENFRFNESGKLIGWIDPIFTIIKQQTPKLNVAMQSVTAPIAIIADFKEAMKNVQESAFDYLTPEQKRDYAHTYTCIRLQQNLTFNIEPSLGYADFKEWAIKANIPDSHWEQLDPTPVSKTNIKFGLPVQGVTHTVQDTLSPTI